MVKKAFSKYAGKKAKEWNQRTLPQYWTLLCVLVCAGFGVYILFETFRPAPPVVAAPIPSFEEDGFTPVGPSDVEPGTQTPQEPGTPGPGTVPVGPGETTRVVDLGGTPVEVSAAAVVAAEQGIRGLFDPEIAKNTPTTSGGVLSAPEKAFPNATVGPLALVSSSPSPLTYTFVASVDADGAETKYGPHNANVTVVLLDGVWMVDA